jgi:hypothetical protein
LCCRWLNAYTCTSCMAIVILIIQIKLETTALAWTIQNMGGWHGPPSIHKHHWLFLFWRVYSDEKSSWLWWKTLHYVASSNAASWMVHNLTSLVLSLSGQEVSWPLDRKRKPRSLASLISRAYSLRFFLLVVCKAHCLSEKIQNINEL